jgi:hypothetical protein
MALVSATDDALRLVLVVVVIVVALKDVTKVLGLGRTKASQLLLYIEMDDKKTIIVTAWQETMEDTFIVKVFLAVSNNKRQTFSNVMQFCFANVIYDCRVSLDEACNKRIRRTNVARTEGG